MTHVTLSADEMDLCRYLEPGEAWRTQADIERSKLFDTLRERRRAFLATCVAVATAVEDDALPAGSVVRFRDRGDTVEVEMPSGEVRSITRQHGESASSAVTRALEAK